MLAQGDDVAAIPGTRRIKYLDENLGAAKVALTAQDMQELDAVLAEVQVRVWRTSSASFEGYSMEQSRAWPWLCEGRQVGGTSTTLLPATPPPAQIEGERYGTMGGHQTFHYDS